MNLTEFLLARLNEDERAAQKLAATDNRPILSLAGTVNHPERILLEVEAKRRVVEALVDAESAMRQVGNEPKNAGDWQEWGNYHAWHEAVQVIALPYADHDDFDGVWRP